MDSDILIHALAIPIPPVRAIGDTIDGFASETSKRCR
jgi:hypothetical protein